MDDITRILQSVAKGDSAARDQLMSLVYDELRGVAARAMVGEAPGHTLQPTALVHEAWLRLVDNGPLDFKNRAHFFTAAAQAMRRILIDHARSKKALKRGAGVEHVDLDGVDVAARADATTLLRIHEALEKLALEDRASAELVELRFFGGLQIEEAAAALSISESTAKRYWVFARAWLYNELCREASR